MQLYPVPITYLDHTTTKKPKTKYNDAIDYLNIAASFDIETTSDYYYGNKIAYMYVWQVSIENMYYYGRDFTTLKAFINELIATYDLNANKRMVIYVHNLGYEFQFIRKHFEWLEVFAVNERKPLKATTTGGIEFRCSYMLSGFSLESLARNLLSKDVKKLVDNMDYELIRHHETELTPEEMAYCKNDVEIVTTYIKEQMSIYGDIVKIPLTNTGRVRTYVRNQCYYSDKNHRKSSKTKYTKYRQIMKDLTLTPEIYTQLKRAFMGGFTHANANKTGQIIPNVTSIDFTSSYPAVMCAEKFPMTRFKKHQFKSIDDILKLSNTHAAIFDIKFHNITVKIEQEVYISESKCITLKNPIINNGRIFSADELTTTLTDIDLDIMNICYSWERVEIANAHVSLKQYLPKSIIQSILNLYQDKTELKDVVGFEVEYMLSKNMLNSIYGMSVTDIVKDRAEYIGENWELTKVDINEEIDEYNESKNRFLFYPWGLWVTAYARKNLWTGIIAASTDYIYSDTDSLKLTNYDRYKGYIKWFDDGMLNKLKSMCKYHRIDPKLLTPKTKDGIEKPLGVWDYEGTYTNFKTLGAKRYLIENDGDYYLTVAGLSKINGIEYLKEIGVDSEGVFSLFNDNLYIPKERTGKMTHTYIDNSMLVTSTDYNGHTVEIETLSGVHLEKQHYELSISKQYNEFLKNLSLGYIFKGVNHG